MRDILEYMGVFADGRGYFGEAQKVELPKLAMATRDFSASGMAGPIKVRLSRLAEAMEMKLHFETMPGELFDLLSASEGEVFPFRIKGSVKGADGTVKAHEIVARGFAPEIDEGTWQDGEATTFAPMIYLRHYERWVDGVEKWVVNPESMILRRDGVDLLAEHRANIGRLEGSMSTETLTLQYPVTYKGEEVTTLTFRRPKIRDMKKAEKIKDDLDKSIAMMADLAEVEPKMIEELDTVDFEAASQIIADFMPEQSAGEKPN